MLTSPTITAAAAEAHVNPKTLTRWLAQPAFIAELKAAQAGIIDRASGRLVQGLDLALDTLSDLMTSEYGENVRRAAASAWLDKWQAVRQETELERRITDLERQAKR